MEDAPVFTDIVVNKIDSKNGKSITGKDFEFTIYKDEACKDMIATAEGDKSNGIAEFEQMRYGTYYLKETRAPKGYNLSDQIVEVVLDNNTKDIGGSLIIEFENIMTQNDVITDDDNEVELYYLSILISCMLYLFIRRRRNISEDLSGYDI